MIHYEDIWVTAKNKCDDNSELNKMHQFFKNDLMLLYELRI